MDTANDYLEALRSALIGSDPALIQDAISDAAEFLRSERAELGEDTEERELVRRTIDRFGSPEEVASSYREVDRHVSRALEPRAPALGLGLLQGVFGVLVDPRAFGALFFMLLSLVTGVLYFTWATVGLSMSAGFSLLIFGAPVFIVFAASLRMLALTEGRLIETLLGVRMPRRPPAMPALRGIWPRVRYWLTDRRTWTSLLYFVLKAPIGILTFTVAVVFLSFSLALFALPIAQVFIDQPLLQILDQRFRVPLWAFPLTWGGALVDLLLVLHLAKATGRAQAAMARWMLVASD